MGEVMERFRECKRAYIWARAVYELVMERVTELNKGLEEALDRGELTEEQCVALQVENRYRPIYLGSGVELSLEDAEKIMSKAEDELIQAGLDALEAVLDGEKRRELAPLWDYWRSDKLFLVRSEVVDLFMRWDP